MRAYECGFRRRTLLGFSVNKDREEGEVPLLARQLPSGHGEGEVTPLLMDGGSLRGSLDPLLMETASASPAHPRAPACGHLAPPASPPRVRRAPPGDPGPDPSPNPAVPHRLASCPR